MAPGVHPFPPGTAVSMWVTLLPSIVTYCIPVQPPSPAQLIGMGPKSDGKVEQSTVLSSNSLSTPFPCPLPPTSDTDDRDAGCKDVTVDVIEEAMDGMGWV